MVLVPYGIIISMASKHVYYQCSVCGFISSYMTALCPKCDSVDSFVTVKDDEDKASPGLKIGSSSTASSSSSRVMTVKELKDTGTKRIRTGVDEFDRLLGGGMVPGQVVLIGAEPGFGKSTLCLEILGRMAEAGMTALYATGEESAPQIAGRARRIGISSDNLKILATTEIEDIIGKADEIHADVVCVDSLQAVASREVAGGLGGMSQSKEASFTFREYAKKHAVPFLLVSQFTKSDDVAGSNQIPHVVDTILVGDADRDTPLKFLRSRKNRYGRTGKTAVFVHEDDGLKSVPDPSRYLLGELDSDLPGAARTIIADGGRLLPVEVDALCSESSYANPQRQFNGILAPRGRILVARLMASCGNRLQLDKMDVFVSTVNNMRVTDPYSDLAVVAAIMSACDVGLTEQPTAWIGEVALTGQVRGRNLMEDRVKEAARLGFSKVVCSSSAAESIGRSVRKRIEVMPISRVEDALHVH